MTLAQRYAALGIIALTALQFMWHGWLLPASRGNPWLIAALFATPMMPALLLLVLARRSALFWGGVGALLYFSHGIAEVWTTPEARLLAWTEVGLSVWVVVTVSWAGLRARFVKRAAKV